MHYVLLKTVFSVYILCLLCILPRSVGGALPTITCPPKGYEPCDLNAIQLNKYDPDTLFVSEVKDVKSHHCTGFIVKVENGHYIPAHVASAAYLCSDDGIGTTEIALIYFSGILKEDIDTSISFGLHWNVKATLMLSHKISQPNVNHYYGRVALKRYDCQTSFGMLASMTMVNKHGVEGSWLLVYRSKDKVTTKTTELVLCACRYNKRCVDAVDYNEFLIKPDIEGPMISERIDVTCFYGARCLISIPGVYHTLSRTMGLLHPSKGNTVKRLQYSNIHYEYLFVGDEFPPPGKLTFALCWLPHYPDRPEVIVELGTVTLENNNVGDIFVAPFGGQVIILPSLNALGTVLRYYIFERKQVVDSAAVADPSRLIWTLSYEIQLSKSGLVVDFNFDPDMKYSLRYMPEYSGNIQNVDSPTFYNTAVLGNLVPQGVRNHSRVQCTYPGTCIVTLETVNMQRFKGSSAPVIIARSCDDTMVLMPFMTKDGKPIEVTTEENKRTSFKWEKHEEGYSLTSGESLKLCWCDKSTKDGADCNGNGYTNEVAQLEVHPSYTEPIICYIGSTCSAYIEYPYMEALDYFMSPDAKVENACQFANQSPFFEKDTIVTDGKRFIHLTGVLDSSPEYIGNYHLYSISLDSITGQITTTQLIYAFEIKGVALEKTKYYLSTLDRTVLTLKDFDRIHQFFIMEPSCGTPGPISKVYPYREEGVTIDSSVQHRLLKVCWCKAFGSDQCTMSEEYKLELGEVFMSGIELDKDVVCNSNSYCRLDLEFLSYYNLSSGFYGVLTDGVKLVVEESCEHVPLSTEHTLSKQDHTKPYMVKESDGIFILRNHVVFGGLFGRIYPGIYSICLTDSYNSISSLVSDITIRGVFAMNMDITIYLGRPFNIVLRGYNMEKEVTGFLSTDRTCGTQTNDSSFSFIMSDTPNLRYDEDGVDVFWWYDVLIIRKTPVTLSETYINNSTFQHTLYMCIATPNNHFVSGLKYNMYYPPALRRSVHAIDDAKGLTFLPRSISSPLIQSSLLVVKGLKEYSSGVCCESNNWDEDPSSISVREYAFTPPHNDTTFPTLLDTSNTYVCWCVGVGCVTLNDFRVSIFLPNTSDSSAFHMIPFVPSVMKASINGMYSSYFDEIRMVNPRIQCGSMNSSKPGSYLQLKGHITSEAMMETGFHMDVIEDVYTGVISKGTIARRDEGFEWKSRSMRLKGSSNGSFLMFRMCYCSFLSHNSCKNDEDYSDWVGSVVDGSKGVNEVLLRITIFPSDMDEGVVPCKATYPVSTSTTTVHRVKDDEMTMGQRLSKYVRDNRSLYEGFFVEACYYNFKEGGPYIRDYKHYISKVHRGYFRMQNIYVLRDAVTEVVLYGIGMPVELIAEIAVIPAHDLCVDFSMDICIARSSLKSVLNPNAVMFREIKLVEPGTYKFCLRLNDINDSFGEIVPSLLETAENTLDNLYSNLNGYEGIESLDQPSLVTHARERSIDVLNNSRLTTHTIKHIEGRHKVSFMERTPTTSNWETGGFIVSLPHRVLCISDLMLFPFDSHDDIQTVGLPQKTKHSCGIPGYSNYVMLCSLVKSGMFIVSDCKDVLWAVTIPKTTDPISSKQGPWRINLLSSPVERDIWKTCKEYPSRSLIVFLGRQHVVIVKAPLSPTNPEILGSFQHGLNKPLDIALCDSTVIISDEYTRTMTSYTFPRNIFKSAYVTAVLMRNCYHNALYVMGKEGSPFDLFALDAMNNSLVHYKLENGASLTVHVSAKYTGVGPSSGVDAGPLDRPCCIDGYLQEHLQDEVKILLVGENVSGRILVFKVDASSIGVYKVIHTAGIRTSLTVNSETRSLLLSSWRLSQGQMTNCILFRTIDSFVDLDFAYNTLDNYQIGTTIELAPILKGDHFEFFMEHLGGGKRVSALKSLGLSLDGRTGVITGRLMSTGVFVLKIIGGNMLKQIVRPLIMTVLCPPSHQWNATTQKCEQCPVGFYRNYETADACVPCTRHRAHTTTQMAGARFDSDCLCDKGFFLENNECVPCEKGALKFEIGNEKCTGKCGTNMKPISRIEYGIESIHCVCVEGFFELKLALTEWNTLPKDILSLTGLTFTDDNPNEPTNLESLLEYEDICIPCAIGYYCPGEKILPKACGTARTTQGRSSTSESSCVCELGYGFDPKKGCVPCSSFGYKDTIGNVPCVPCGTQPTDDRHNSGLTNVPLMGPIGIIDVEKWNEELWQKRLKDNVAHSKLTTLLKTSKMFTISEGSINGTQCLLCAAGTYMDGNTRLCVSCPTGKFCPGGDSQPISCGPNSVTRGVMAASPFDCYCPRGYGNLYEGRHPINGMISCQPCPFGTFQHLEYSDGGCIPCPRHSSTLGLGTTSIVKCIPKAGYYLHVRKDSEEVSVSTILKEYGNDFEHFVSTNHQVSLDCVRAHSYGITYKKHLTLIRPNEDVCASECKDNIYCKGYSFDKTTRFFDSDYDSSKANEVLQFNGLRLVKHSFGICTLYLLNLTFIALSEEELQTATGKDVITLCVVRASSVRIVFSMTLCPNGYYCDNTIAHIACPPHSTTLGLGATSISDCLCSPGYEPSSLRRGLCMACPLASYKQEVGNTTCRRCPDKFRTFYPGSKYITDCACTPGHYARLTSEGSRTLSHTAVYKRMNDGRFLTSSDGEVSQFKRMLGVGSNDGGSTNLNRSESIDVYTMLQNGGAHMQIDSFIYLSKDALLLPQSAAITVLKRFSDYQTITCERCKPHHYCPGGWVPDSPDRKIHNIPYSCPSGSTVPAESTNATSISHCLCMPGYRLKTTAFYNEDDLSANMAVRDRDNLRGETKDSSESSQHGDKSSHSTVSEGPGPLHYSTVHAFTGDDQYSGTISTASNSNSDARGKRRRRHIEVHGYYPQCVKCDSGMYKEGQENSSCSGRCMQHATTFGGAMSKKQCFCNYGRYMTFEGSLGSVQLTCAPCMKGAICPGGLHPNIVEQLKKNGGYDNIGLADHLKPIPRFGFFAAFKEQGAGPWSPSTQPMIPLDSVLTEMFDFHPCPLEYMCASNDASHCLPGSTGYLCLHCHDGYDRLYFRGPCSICGGVFRELVGYFHGRLALWTVGVLVTFLLRHKLFYHLVILKIWADFCFSMAPYGVIPLNTPSSIRRFSAYYNRFLGFQQTLFRYIRLGCIIDMLSVKALSHTQMWYVQKFSVAVQPLVDALLMYLVLLLARSLYRIIRIPYRRYSRSSRRDATVAQPTESSQTTGDVVVKRSRSIKSASSGTGPAKISRRRPWVSFWDCAVSLYYLSFQFICQELLQLLWCVDVKYKSEAPISVLLYMPSQVCRCDDPLFVSGMVFASAFLTILVGYYTVTLMFIVRQRRGNRLYTCGRQKHTLAWDAAMFLRRFVVAMITIFQPSMSSTGSAERMRMLASILITTLLLIAHMSILPYQVRDDNLFNRLELISLAINNLTAFLLLGSFSYDFNYNSLIPLAACLFYVLLLLWYLLVEWGFVSELRPRLRRHWGLCRGFWHFCRQLLVWHCHSQISFDYTRAEMVIEKPYAGYASTTSTTTKAGRKDRRAKVSMQGRRSLCLCLEQSVSRYVMEQRCFSIPLYWKEFMLRYSFGFRDANLKIWRCTIASDDIHVNDMFAPTLFNQGPINTWQLSIATLKVPLHRLIVLYKEFERHKFSALWRLKYLYSELCFEATEALSVRNMDVPNMIDKVHLHHNLKNRTKYLEHELESRVRNAQDGERVTRDVQQLAEGILSLVDAPLTNEEIVQQIAELEHQNAIKDNATY